MPAKINHITSHLVKPLVNLQALIAHSCGLQRASFIRHLPLLNTLILSKNELTSFPLLSSQVQLVHLTKLSLSDNRLTEVPDLAALPNLTELRINNNKIPAISANLLAGRKLRVLDLAKNLLSSWEELAAAVPDEPDFERKPFLCVRVLPSARHLRPGAAARGHLGRQGRGRDGPSLPPLRAESVPEVCGCGG